MYLDFYQTKFSLESIFSVFIKQDFNKNLLPFNPPKLQSQLLKVIKEDFYHEKNQVSSELCVKIYIQVCESHAKVSSISDISSFYRLPWGVFS